MLADIGDRIRAERQARRWSQAELARRAGMDGATVKRIESGIGPLRCFVQVCWGLNVPMSHLLSDEWQMPEYTPSLSQRQLQVLREVASGDSLTEAGVRLGMPRPAVAAHLSRIYHRLGVAGLPVEDRRAAAVQVAMRHGLFDPQTRTS